MLPFSEGSAHQGSNDSNKADFPYGILMVVSVGVTLGVFIGGLLLFLAVRFMKRYHVNSHLSVVKKRKLML